MIDYHAWSLFVGQCLLEPSKCPALASQPHVMDSAAEILNLMQLLDCCSICIGNTEAEYLKVLSYCLTTPHGKYKNSQKMIYAYVYLSLIIIIMTAAIYAFFSECSSDVPCAAFCDESQPATPTV